jgi:coenzyme F420-dependent glucose-6-phosphate dehydrogenase
VEKIGPYLDLGFQDLVLHFPGDDQKRSLDQFAEDVLPALRERAKQQTLAAAGESS